MAHSDNFSEVTLALDKTVFTCEDLGEVEVTLIATDEDGNASECSTQVVVEDNLAPIIPSNFEIELDENGVATISGSLEDAGIIDNCGVATITVDQDAFDTTGTATVLITATDGSGNSTTSTSTVTIVDVMPPEAECIAAVSITLELDANGEAFLTPEEIDNGSTDNFSAVSLALDKTVFTCADIGETEVTLIVTDQDGNQGECSTLVMVEDNLAPIIPSDFEIELDENGIATISGSLQDAGIVDNCGIATVTVDQDEFDETGTATVQITVTDDSGNSATSTSTVTIVDVIPPEAECIAAVSITLELDANGEAFLTPEEVDNGSFDNFSDITLALDKTVLTCEDLGVAEVTLIVTDEDGNQSECSTFVLVEDNLPPTIPSDFEIELDENGVATISGSLEDAGIVDNCGSVTVTVDQDEFDETGTTTVQITATDDSGNSATETATVTIIDALPPTAECIAASSIVLELDSNGQAELTAEQIDNGSTDNFSEVTLSLSQTMFNCDDIGANEVTLMVKDEDGNMSSCTTTVIVEDQIAPTIPNDIEIALDENGIATISGSLERAGIVDNCGIGSVTVDQDEFDETGTATVEITVTDPSGNTTTQITTVTIVDDLPPTAACVANSSITLALDANGQAMLTPEEVDNGSADNFSDVTLSLSQTIFTCDDLGSNEVTLFVTDEDGNQSTCTSTVVVEDNLAPFIPSAFEIGLGENGIATISGSLAEAGIVDNCGITSLVVDQDKFDETGTAIVEITATDASGNSTTVVATVTIVDVLPPTAVCVASSSVELELDENGQATLSAEDVDNGSADNFSDVTLALSQTLFTCDDIGSQEVTLIVTDEDGNQSTCTTTVTVEDNIAPTVPADFELELDENGIATISGSLETIGIMDNCGIASLSVSQNEFDQTGTATVEITVIDPSGNSTTQTATVTIIDVLPPTAVCAPISSIVLGLDASGQAILTPEQVDNGSTDNFSNVTLALSQSVFTCDDLGANKVALIVTDKDGNESTCSTIVTVEDNMAPTILDLVEVELNDQGSVNLNDVIDSFGIEDNCDIVSVTFSQEEFTEEGTFEVIVTAEDQAGNVTEQLVRVVISDGPRVTSLSLISTENGDFISALLDGSVIDLVDPNLPPYSIVADVNKPDEVGSVQFFLNGDLVKTENFIPYSISGDENGIPRPFSLEVGSYTLTVIAYTESQGGGEAGLPFEVNFEVINSSAVSQFDLINASTDERIRTLVDGDVIDVAEAPNLSIEAITSPSPVGSLQFTLNGDFLRNENVVPYALGGDQGGDFAAFEFEAGSYTLTATPFEFKNAEGSSGTPSTINFTVVNSQSLSSFAIIDRKTQEQIGTLQDGDIIDLSETDFQDAIIWALTDDEGIGSVVFTLDGEVVDVDSTDPFSLTEAFTPGSHTLVATPYSRRNGEGVAGTPLTVTYEVITPVKVDEFVLIDTDADAAIRGIEDGDVIDLAEAQNLSVQILANTDFVKSVEVFVNGKFERLERSLPFFSIAGDRRGDFRPFDFEPGDYTITAVPYGDERAEGEAGEPLSISFSVINTQSVSEFIIVDKGSKEVIQTLENGDVLDLSDPKFDNFVIYAQTSGQGIGSVVTTLNGDVIDVDNKAPYSIHGPFAPGSYRLTSTPFTGSNGKGTAGEPLSVDFEVISPLSIDGFDLINTKTDRKIRSLVDGDVIDLAEAKELSIQILANTSIVKSVEVFLDGQFIRRERSLPVYSLGGDRRGDFHAFDFEPGSYTLMAIPYGDTQSEGAPGPKATLNFSVVDSRPAPSLSISSLVLVETKNNKEIGELEDGDVLHFSQRILDNLTIVAKPGSGKVGSVDFILNGRRVKTENNEPYAIAGDRGQKLHRFNFAPGHYELTVVPYSKSRRGGEAGESLTVSFTVPGKKGKRIVQEVNEVDNLVPAKISTTAYPNPFTSELSVSVTNLSENGTLLLMDLSGKILWNQAVEAGKAGTTVIELDNLNVPIGQYVLLLRAGSQQITHRVIKQ